MSEKALYAALSKAQAEMPSVGFDSTGQHRNKYASLGAIIDAVRPILAKHDLALMQFPVGRQGNVGVRNVLTHAEGGSIEYEIHLPLEVPLNRDGRPMLAREQAGGIILSYLRRYSLASIFMLYAEPDTDGNTVSQAPQKPTGQRRQAQEPVRIPEADKGQKQGAKRSWPADLIMRLVGEVDDIKAPPHAVNVMNQSPFVGEDDDELNYTAIIAWAKARKEESDD